MPLQIGKTPIVVPRQHQFNEHVNDHQVEFARNVAQRMGTIIPVEDIETLGDIITNYDQIVAGITVQHQVGCESVMLVKKDVLVLNGQKLVQGMQVHKQLMLKISYSFDAINSSFLSNRLDTKDYCFYIDENSIFAENRQLPHKDAGIFDDFYMIPVKKGDDAEKNAVIISLKNGE